MKSPLIGLSALALAAGTAIVVPADPASRAEAQRGPARGALTYVAKAGAGDLYEIESSRLAMERAARPGVREFARMLVDDHRRGTERVAAAARADRINPPPPRLEPRHRSMLRQLERARGPAFDQLYLNQQIPAHQDALALHRNQARRGAGNDLRRVAASIVPVVEGHLTQARRLQRMR